MGKQTFLLQQTRTGRGRAGGMPYPFHLHKPRLHVQAQAAVRLPCLRMWLIVSLLLWFHIEIPGVLLRSQAPCSGVLYCQKGAREGGQESREN